MGNTKFSLRKAVLEFLNANIGNAYTAKEIAQILANKYPNAVKEKISASKSLKTEEDCIGQWSAEIPVCKAFFEKNNVYLSSDRPRTYSMRADNKTASGKIENNASDGTNICQDKECNIQHEKELYPKLAEYCKSLKIETLRIDEKKSIKKGANSNRWLHADLVGFQDLVSDFTNEAKECLIEYSDTRSFLYSFEVKDDVITVGNLRESFFQTVSNSSWANFSYLVAEGVEDRAWEELQLLCASFDIGFIQLDKANPLESQIKIKAPQTDLDWSMINRIAEVNPDFKKFLKNITLAYKRHSDPNFAKPKWDIPEDSEK